jgi:hypothetical protein
MDADDQVKEGNARHRERDEEARDHGSPPARRGIATDGANDRGRSSATVIKEWSLLARRYLALQAPSAMWAA